MGAEELRLANLVPLMPVRVACGISLRVSAAVQAATHSSCSSVRRLSWLRTSAAAAHEIPLPPVPLLRMPKIHQLPFLSLRAAV